MVAEQIFPRQLSISTSPEPRRRVFKALCKGVGAMLGSVTFEDTDASYTAKVVLAAVSDETNSTTVYVHRLARP
jgi:hypothetical protein